MHPAPSCRNTNVRIARTGVTIRQFRDRSSRYDYDANVMSLRPKMAFFQTAGAVAREGLRSSFRRVIVPHVSRESWGLRVCVLDASASSPVVRRSGSCGPQVKPLSPAARERGRRTGRGPRATPPSQYWLTLGGLLPSVPMITARRPSRRSLAFGGKAPAAKREKLTWLNAAIVRWRILPGGT